MKNKLKRIFTNQGFNCQNIEDKKRIWEKLTDAGYSMCYKPQYHYYMTIVFIDGQFCNFGTVGESLNESEFFDETEWTPKPGEWVEVSNDGIKWGGKRQYLCSIDDVHLCVRFGETYKEKDRYNTWLHIRQVPTIQEMTIAEAEQRFKIKIKQP
jgi:hypothetical protein